MVLVFEYRDNGNSTSRTVTSARAYKEVIDTKNVRQYDMKEDFRGKRAH